MTYKNRHGLKFGTDPEMFASYTNEVPDSTFNPDVPFSVIPAYVGDTNIVLAPMGGDLKHPLYAEGDTYKIIGDGAAYEINLKAPCTSPHQMWDMVNQAKDGLKTLLESAGYKLYTHPLINFDFRRWWTDKYQADARYYWSMIFGCDPDQDAFNVNWLCKIEDESKHPYRYGGGHLHISGNDDMLKYPIPFVKLLAIYLGNYGVVSSKDPELEKVRAKVYGKPGKYRIQKYPDGSQGIEYRTLSNSWLNHEEDDFEFMFDLIDVCIDLLTNKTEAKRILNDYSEPTVAAITNADQNLSMGILKSLGVL